MDTHLLVFIIAFCISVLLIIILILLYLNDSRYKTFLNNHSIRLLKLIELNEKYIFYDDINLLIYHEYDNKNIYDNISATDFLIYQLNTSRKSEIIRDIKYVDYNKNNYNKYIDEVNELDKHIYDIDTHKYNVIRLNKYEDKLYNKLLKKPIINYQLYVVLYRTDINGRRYENKYSTFNPDEINGYIKRLDNKSGYFYKDESIWDSLCKVERGKVSNKIRFKVYKRDGYKCKYCGSTNNLEIDHIIPISKGGKSNIDNLQTLCHNCNILKGDNF